MRQELFATGPISTASAMATKADQREKLARDVERFIAKGGHIDHVDHTANRAAPTTAYNNEPADKMHQRNRQRKTQPRTSCKRPDLKYGAQSCNRDHAS